MNQYWQETLFPNPIRNYIGCTWSILSTEEKAEIIDIVDRIVAVGKEFGLNHFVSRTECPPGTRKGPESRKLWLRLRKEMANCHLFSFVYAGATIGGTKELRNAKDFLVPTIFFVKAGVHIHELFESPSLKCLKELTYADANEAEEKFRQFLKNEITNVRFLGLETERNRFATRNSLRVGEMIKYLREEAALTRDQLAEKSGLTTEEIAGIEMDIETVNPPLIYFSAIARSLGVDLNHLFQTPDQLESRRRDLRITEIAKNLGWSIELIDEFRKSRWGETRRSWTKNTSDQEIREELVTWHIQWERGN